MSSHPEVTTNLSSEEIIPKLTKIDTPFGDAMTAKGDAFEGTYLRYCLVTPIVFLEIGQYTSNGLRNNKRKTNSRIGFPLIWPLIKMLMIRFLLILEFLEIVVMC